MYPSGCRTIQGRKEDAGQLKDCIDPGNVKPSYCTCKVSTVEPAAIERLCSGFRIVVIALENRYVDIHEFFVRLHKVVMCARCKCLVSYLHDEVSSKDDFANLLAIPCNVSHFCIDHTHIIRDKIHMSLSC